MEDDISEFRPALDRMNSYGARLSQLTSKEGAKTLEEMSSRISRRFDAVCEQFQRRAERLAISRQRSSEVKKLFFFYSFFARKVFLSFIKGRRRFG